MLNILLMGGGVDLIWVEGVLTYLPTEVAIHINSYLDT